MDQTGKFEQVGSKFGGPSFSEARRAAVARGKEPTIEEAAGPGDAVQFHKEGSGITR